MDCLHTWIKILLTNNKTKNKMEKCGNPIYLKNGQLVIVDDNGNCTPFTLQVNNLQGPRGKQGPAGASSNIESGTFSRTALQGSGVQTITTTKRPKLVFLNANAGGANASFGKDDATNADCVSFNPSGSDNSDESNSINFASAGDGFTAKITAITSTSFQITWTIVGAGKDVDVQWHAITE